MNFMKVLWLLFFCHLASTQNTIVFGNNGPNVALSKCSCGSNEGLLNDTCTNIEKTLVPFWDTQLSNINHVNISSLSVSLNPILSCPNGTRKTAIPYFLIYEDGHLDNLAWSEDPLYSSYCIEFHSVNYTMKAYAEVCTEIPKVSLCCESDTCIQKPLTRPIMHGDIPWENFTVINTEITCTNGTVLTEEAVRSWNQYGTALVGFPPGKFLQYITQYMNSEAYFNQNEYCLKPGLDGDYISRFCVPDPKILHDTTCSNATCIRKCCPPAMIYDKDYSCVPDNRTLQFIFYSSDMSPLDAPDDIRMLYGAPICDDYILTDEIKLAEGSNDTVAVVNGRISVKNLIQNDSSKFCVDFVLDNHQNYETVPNVAAVTCLIPLKDKCQWRFVFGSILLGISCLFYLATIVIYIGIPELRAKMSGKCLISQVSALLVSYAILIFLQNSRNYMVVTCSLPGTIAHVTALAAFFWLNVMCYDVWRTLRSMKVVSTKSVTSNRRFILYCLYGWGVPILISLVRFIIDSLPNEAIASSWLVRADLGKTHCFFTSSYATAKWVYLYLPVLIILIINTFFFVNVAIILAKAHKENKKRLHGSNSGKTGKNLNKKKQRALLYLKLFLVMGLSWMLEIIMFVAVPENDCYFWVLDIVNMFQGVLIFGIFVCKQSTLRKIKAYFDIGHNRSNNINLDW